MLYWNILYGKNKLAGNIFTFHFTSWLLSCFQISHFDIVLHKLSGSKWSRIIEDTAEELLEYIINHNNSYSRMRWISQLRRITKTVGEEMKRRVCALGYQGNMIKALAHTFDLINLKHRTS